MLFAKKFVHIRIPQGMPRLLVGSVVHSAYQQLFGFSLGHNTVSKLAACAVAPLLRIASNILPCAAILSSPTLVQVPVDCDLGTRVTEQVLHSLDVGSTAN